MGKEHFRPFYIKPTNCGDSRRYDAYCDWCRRVWKCEPAEEMIWRYINSSLRTV